MAAARYLHENGLTEADIAEVAVANQKWGVHHPHAAKARFGEIDVDKVLSSPYVSSPLRRWMCSTWGGGTGGALVVTSPDNVKAGQEAVYLTGYGTATTHEYMTDRMNMRTAPFPSMAGTYPGMIPTATVEAARQAFEMADVGRDDIDMVEISANFAHMGPIILEDLGFASRGKGVEIYRSGRSGVDGDLPVDTNGGWLSFGQPGISCNMDTMVEAVRQLRGIPLGLPPRKKPSTVLVQGAGGMLAAGTVLVFTTDKGGI